MLGADRDDRLWQADAALHDAVVRLNDVAIAVDRACAAFGTDLELIEASHSIHAALVRLTDVRSPRDIASSGRGDAPLVLDAAR